MAKKKSRKIFKGILCVLCAVALVFGGYYAGYSNRVSSIISAIPKQSLLGIGEKPSTAVDSTNIQESENAAEAGKYIGISKETAIDGTWPMIDIYEWDINSDGKEDTISLYTSAEKEGDEILWDDSQKWVLEVKTDEGYYILLNQNISNGRVYFDFDEVEDGSYVITLYISSTLGMNIKQYTYNKTGFVETQIYQSNSINNLHSGIPTYR